MGNQCVGRHDNLYQKIKNSYIGALVPTMVMPSLICLFKAEKHGDLRLNRRIACRNKALIVVLTGRVDLLVNKMGNGASSNDNQSKSDRLGRRLSLMKASKKDSICSYVPGDIISFFGSTEFDSNFNADGSFNFDDDISITLTAAVSNTTIAYIEIADLNGFLKGNPKLTSLKAMCNLSLSSMLSGQNLYRGVPSKQLEMLGLFMKVSIVLDQTLVNTHPARALRIKNLRRHSTSPLCAVLLQGVLNRVTDQELEGLEPVNVVPHWGSVKSRATDLFSLSRSGAVSVSSSRYASIHAFDDSALQKHDSHEKLTTGHTFGMRCLFYKSKVEGVSLPMEPEPDNIYAFGTCIIGEFSTPALKSLLNHANSVFTKRMTANFTRHAMETVAEYIPFIAEMPKDKREKLGKELRLAYFDNGDKLFSEGEPGDALYIIVDGAVKETKGDTTEFFSSSEYVGEVAITSEDIHRSTAVAVTKTFAIEMTAKSFNDIFNNNNESSEVKIRMAGKKVELHVILDYPQTYSLFEKFLKKEHNEENISFYHSVKRYELMAHLVHDKIVKLGPKAASRTLSSTKVTATDIEISQPGNVTTTSDLIQSLAHSIRELLEIAESDCQKYIDEGSKEQVNVSGATRLAVMTELGRLKEEKKAFNELTSSATDASVEAVLHNAEPLVDLLSCLFDRPKKEIYDVMAKDPFQRWKQTPEFDKVIETLKAVKDPLAKDNFLGRRGSSYNLTEDSGDSDHRGSIGIATGVMLRLRRLSGFTGLKGPPPQHKKAARAQLGSRKLIGISEDQ